MTHRREDFQGFVGEEGFEDFTPGPFEGSPDFVRYYWQLAEDVIEHGAMHLETGTFEGCYFTVSGPEARFFESLRDVEYVAVYRRRGDLSFVAYNTFGKLRDMLAWWADANKPEPVFERAGVHLLAHHSAEYRLGCPGILASAMYLAHCLRVAGVSWWEEERRPFNNALDLWRVADDDAGKLDKATDQLDSWLSRVVERTKSDGGCPMRVLDDSGHLHLWVELTNFKTLVD